MDKKKKKMKDEVEKLSKEEQQALLDDANLERREGMKEETAKNRLCPFTVEQEFYPSIESMGTISSKCVADRCMSWGYQKVGGDIVPDSGYCVLLRMKP